MAAALYRDAADFYRDARDDLVGPLDGVRVLDVTKVWSGPLAGAVLADLGADVVRVELPHGRDGEVPPRIPGTGLSWFRQTVNRNKRSVGLDLRRTEGREGFLRLVATADVVVENYKPGTLDGWGVGWAQCRAVRPDLVLVSISGWGQFGSRRAEAAYDPVIQAASGWMALNGTPDGGPVRAPTFLADELAGLHGALGALAALWHRQRTGEGQHVDVAMFDTMVAGSAGLHTLAAAGRPPQRWGNQTDFVVPANVYPCVDGQVYLAVALDRHWRELAEVVSRPELARAEGFARAADRLANRVEVDAVLARWCAPRPADEVVAALVRRGLTASRVRTVAEVAADPYLAERAMLQPTSLCDGSTAPIVGPAAKFSRTPTRVRRGAPEPGADTAQVLAELAAPDTGHQSKHTTPLADGCADGSVC
ncbi:CaiB/BaiF CoA-transferase family protein [Salinispora sp. H7-4]|uniref:CaiB/BaiF CoA transferase family protein n=1 Tax=Salinispora sp. H7-4 TaxID=2748321 RepID=UPI0015D3DA3C|nr:CoA transferase [Salinispora sp. H7-4]NYT95630.1 CoA transferase [Salinispora sp. H7-4]